MVYTPAPSVAVGVKFVVQVIGLLVPTQFGALNVPGAVDANINPPVGVPPPTQESVPVTAVADRFAVPAPGEYHGSIDGHPTVIRVAGDGLIATMADAQPGAMVAVAFLQRRD